MLGFDNYIVKNEVSKLTKDFKELDCNEKADKSNEKNVEVRQRVLNELKFWREQKNFIAVFCPAWA